MKVLIKPVVLSGDMKVFIGDRALPSIEVEAQPADTVERQLSQWLSDVFRFDVSFFKVNFVSSAIEGRILYLAFACWLEKHVEFTGHGEWREIPECLDNKTIPLIDRSFIGASGGKIWA